MKLHNINNQNHGNFRQSINTTTQKSKIFFREIANKVIRAGDKKIHKSTQPEHSCCHKNIRDRKTSWLNKIKLYLNYAGCWLVLKTHLYDDLKSKKDVQEQMEEIKREISSIKITESRKKDFKIMRNGFKTIKDGTKQVFSSIKNSATNLFRMHF